MLGFCKNPLFGRPLRAMAELVIFFKNLDPPGKPSILLLFARIAPIFDLLGAGISSNMKWKANAKLEDTVASKYLSSQSLGFRSAPQRD